MTIEVFTDGSATTNDKPGGYAWVMVIDGKKHSEGSGHMPMASNNDAELEAAIQGLSAVKTYMVTPPEVLGRYDVLELIPPEVTLVSDSQLILGWASGKYTFRQQDKLEKYQQLRLLIALLNAQTRWVEGHSGNEFNERCDQLANEARTGISNPNQIGTVLQNTAIGSKKKGIVCIWYKNSLKIIDLEANIVEDYDRAKHGPRGSMFEIREEKSR